MTKTSVTVAHIVFTSLVAVSATGCMASGKLTFGTSMPSASHAGSVEQSPSSSPSSSSSSGSPSAPVSSPAAEPAAPAEPAVQRFKLDLIRAEAGLNESTSKTCLESYSALISAGVSPSYRMRFRDEEGAIESLKQKYCVDAAANHAKAEAQRTAPLRAKLESDKLKMAIQSHYAIAGGDYSMDPAKLAAAPVWFDSVGAPSNEKQHCDNGGKRNIIRRYQFNAKHELVKTSQRQYCGEPPKSAYR